jgi:hypothetical protein
MQQVEAPLFVPYLSEILAHSGGCLATKHLLKLINGLDLNDSDEFSLNRVIVIVIVVVYSGAGSWLDCSPVVMQDVKIE